MRILFILFLSVITLISCDKSGCDAEPNLNVDQAQLQADVEEIDAYLAERNMQAQEHPSGIRYIILNEGDGDRPSICNGVIVDYSGKLLGATSNFEKSDRPIGFNLGGLISGWQIGIPLIRERGEIRLFIPSVYGYGSSGSSSGSIPPNSVLDFTIDLYVVQ